MLLDFIINLEVLRVNVNIRCENIRLYDLILNLSMNYVLLRDISQVVTYRSNGES